jgi:hypothetical protein
VGQHSRIEYGQYDRDKRRPTAEILARGKVHHEGKGNGDQIRCHSHLKYHLIAVAVVSGEPVASVQIRFDLEVAVVRGGTPEIAPEQRDRGQQFNQWRMFGVQAVVVRVPHHVAGIHMILFVECERLAMNRKSGNAELDCDQCGHDRAESSCRQGKPPYQNRKMHADRVRVILLPCYLSPPDRGSAPPAA